MPRIRSLFRASSVGLVVLWTSGHAGAQCPQVGGAGTAGPAAQNRVGVVAAHDPLCPQDVPCYGTRDALIYLKLPSIQSIGGRSSHSEFSADGLNSFLTVFHSAAAKGVENATIRAFNAARACPDGKNCDPPQAPGAPAGGQVPLGEGMVGQQGPLDLAPANVPAGQPSGVQPMGEIQPPGVAPAAGGPPAGAAATSPPLLIEPRTETGPPLILAPPVQRLPSQPATPAPPTPAPATPPPAPPAAATPPPAPPAAAPPAPTTPPPAPPAPAPPAPAPPAPAPPVSA